MSEIRKPPLEALQAVLGYLNFSTGKPDPRFQKQINDACAFWVPLGSSEPWRDCAPLLQESLTALREGGSPAFREVEQAQAVFGLVFDKLLGAYRAHHAVLLGHLGDAELFQPFFLARAFEAVLAQRGPWHETERIVRGALKQLNDYVGHRPVAVLETRASAEPYDHERVRPIPLFLRGAGTAWGRYESLISRTLDILQGTEGAVLADACLDPELLDELALDPRGYDFDHPADKRPNYCFGEWDPHAIDAKGNYRRFVLRQVTLEGLWQRVEQESGTARDEYLFEAAAVLACTMLMGAGVSGAGPTTHDSTINLAVLTPRIARYREAFYAALFDSLQGDHAARLRQELKVTRQPFGGARQHLNRYLARQRALQMQQRHLAMLFAEIGYPGGARRQLHGMAAASARLVTEIHILLAGGDMAIDAGRLDLAAASLPAVEELVKKGIACGALADPWNILGFQGQFPRSAALEDSIRDQRIDALVRVMERLFNLFARLLSEGAAKGSFTVAASLAKDMRRLADWWDRFATTTVSDILHVHGGEATLSAGHVAHVLSRWREHGGLPGSGSADLAFWRDQLESFRSPKAFALVVDALLRQQDFRASMSLLMTWLSQVGEVPLEDSDFSFHQLALRWMLGICTSARPRDEQRPLEPLPAPIAVIAKFFDYLEANAEDFGQVPRLDVAGTGQEGPSAAQAPEAGGADDDDSLFGAAYEGMTYKDSTDDDVEGDVLDFAPQGSAGRDFDLSAESERLEKRLKFLATWARLWNVATRAMREASGADRARSQDAVAAWLAKARKNYQGLVALLDAIHEHEVPRASGSFESLVEFDSRRVTKERLLTMVIATCLDQALAVGALRGASDAPLPADVGDEHGHRPGWEYLVLRLERALLNKEPAQASAYLPEFTRHFKQEPLLYTPLTHGGHPRQILRATIAQTMLRGLVANLPRQGLVRETFQLVRLAHAMEQAQTLSGPRVTELDRLFQLAVQAVAEALVEAARREAVGPDRIVETLEIVVEPFLAAWMEHSKTLRVAMLEAVGSDKDWVKLREFIKKYGHDLFHARFMTLANLRGVLSRGIGPYLDYLSENPDPLRPIKLVDDLEHGLPRQEPERWLQVILQTVIENYDHYRDYNSTTTQSDYGENLYQLLDFLRLKASYERNAWQLRPLNWVHEMLAKKHGPAAELWRRQVQAVSEPTSDEHLKELARLEKTHGMRLATVADRLEERFVRPMALDGVCALIEPAMAQARLQTDWQIALQVKDDASALHSEGNPAPAHEPDVTPLEKAPGPLTTVPAGVGLDVPYWILRLESEVSRVRTSKTALVSLAETLFQVPVVPVPFVDFAEQMRDWKKTVV